MSLEFSSTACFFSVVAVTMLLLNQVYIYSVTVTQKVFSKSVPKTRTLHYKLCNVIAFIFFSIAQPF